MSLFNYRITIATPLARSVAIAALLGGTLLASPLTAAPAATAPAQTSPRHGAAAATDSRPETVEQRITGLHTALKITPDEEANWNGVAQAMRENAKAMEMLIAQRTAEGADSMTALQDLDAYGKFAQAHVDGIKNLTAAFGTLYGSMPDPQKKLADKVFQSSRHGRDRAHG